MTGDGGVLKRRLQEGQGEFPVDCPLHDTSVRLHYRVRSLAGPSPGPWVYDSRSPSTAADGGDAEGAGAGVAAEGAAPPVEADTGCGELPEGLELVVKLMVPGELASATCSPHYAYEVRAEGRTHEQEERSWLLEQVRGRVCQASRSSRHLQQPSCAGVIRDTLGLPCSHFRC